MVRQQDKGIDGKRMGTLLPPVVPRAAQSTRVDRSIAPDVDRYDSKEVRRPRRDSTTKCGHAVIVVISCAQRTLRSLSGARVQLWR